MYNRYIPDSDSCQWIQADPEPLPSEETGRNSGLTGLLGGLLDQGKASGLWKHLRLSELDAGDLLVLAIAALLILDKKDIDLGIALILVFLLGFGEGDESS